MRVSLLRPGDLPTLLLGGFDLVARSGQDPGGHTPRTPTADLVVTSADRARLGNLGLRYRILVEDLEEQAAENLGPPPAASSQAPPNFGTGGQGGYYTYAEILGLLDHYAQNYPAIVGVRQVIGTSVEGRPLYALKISDNPAQSEAEPKILLDALHHAREPMAVQTLLFLLHHLATGYGVDPSITQLIDSREIWMVPVVNPDGYVFNETNSPAGGGMWRKNRRSFGACSGVDLNRNYPTFFAFDDFGSGADPCMETFRGAGPLSEPESAAFDQLAAREGFEVVVSLHAHGELLLHPLGYQAQAPANVALYREHGADLSARNGYLPGAISDLLITVNGNAVDHHDLAYGSEAWAFEVGTSFWPPLSEMLPVAEQNLEPLLLLIRYAGALLTPTGHAVSDDVGNRNGCADPGEELDLLVVLKNQGNRSTPGGVTASLTSLDPQLTVLRPQISIGPIAAQQEDSLPVGGLRLRVAASARPGERIPLTLTVAWGGFSVEHTLVLEVGTLRRIAVDHLESDLGWTAGVAGDDAMTGIWTRGDPVQIDHYQNEAQPEDDTTAFPGTHCFITGNNGSAAGQDDVDDGVTTLITPRFSLADTRDPVLRYNRFYWCSKGDNPLIIDVSNDNGLSWVNLETVNGRPNVWLPKQWRLGDFVAPTDAMRIRILARDPLNNSVTEALIDDLELFDFGLTPQVVVFGKLAPGGQVEVQMAGQPGVQLLLFLAYGTGSIRLNGVSGIFGLDPGSARIVQNLGVPADGLLRTPVAIPANPQLVGAQVFLQTIALEPIPVVSNVAVLTLISP